MNARTAIEIASRVEDVSYDEWCGLYVPRNPSAEEIMDACETAYVILVRNDIIEPGTRLIIGRNY